MPTRSSFSLWDALVFTILIRTILSQVVTYIFLHFFLSYKEQNIYPRATTDLHEFEYLHSFFEVA